MPDPATPRQPERNPEQRTKAAGPGPLDIQSTRDWAREVRERLSSLRLAPPKEAQIVDEISQHLEDLWHESIASGMSPDEAAKSALGEFRDGNLLARYIAPLRLAHQPPPVTPGVPAGHLFVDFCRDLRSSPFCRWHWASEPTRRSSASGTGCSTRRCRSFRGPSSW